MLVELAKLVCTFQIFHNISM